MKANGNFYFKWSVILFSAILIFIFFAFFAKKFAQASLELDIKGNKLSVKTSQLQAEPEKITRLDPDRYFVDSMHGFSFEQPNRQRWSKPKLLVGLDAILKAKNMLLTSEMSEAMAAGLAMHPMGEMLNDVEVLRIISGDSIRVEITDQTSNELIDAIIEKIQKAEGTTLSESDLATARRQAIGFERISFSNEFTVSVYDKAKLKNVPINPSLPNFFMTLASAMGLAFDHLVADENSILAGISLTLHQVRLNDQLSDLRIDRWMLVTENAEKYYLVEIAYSPQTTGSIQVWEELRALMDSFHVFNS
jgi:hypothetical protein